MHIPCNLAILLLNANAKGILTQVHEGPCVTLFTARFSVVWQIGSRINAITSKREEKVWWVHTIEHYPAFRSKELGERIFIEMDLIKHSCDWGKSQNEI